MESTKQPQTTPRAILVDQLIKDKYCLKNVFDYQKGAPKITCEHDCQACFAKYFTDKMVRDVYSNRCPIGIFGSKRNTDCELYVDCYECRITILKRIAAELGYELYIPKGEKLYE